MTLLDVTERVHDGVNRALTSVGERNAPWVALVMINDDYNDYAIRISDNINDLDDAQADQFIRRLRSMADNLERTAQQKVSDSSVKLRITDKGVMTDE
jgi:ABC-type enterochelin transport system ATPase subunit